MSERDAFFEKLRREIAAFYLAEPGNAYRASGRSKGAARWEETRRCIAEAVHEDGDFLDVGCANGLLLESLLGWTRWKPPRTYDFVRTNLEYAPSQDWVEFVRRQLAWVAPGGRLILCHYRNEGLGEEAADVASVLREAGMLLTGRASAPGVEIAWTQRDSGA